MVQVSAVLPRPALTTPERWPQADEEDAGGEVDHGERTTDQPPQVQQIYRIFDLCVQSQAMRTVQYAQDSLGAAACSRHTDVVYMKAF